MWVVARQVFALLVIADCAIVTAEQQ